MPVLRRRLLVVLGVTLVGAGLEGWLDSNAARVLVVVAVGAVAMLVSLEAPRKGPHRPAATRGRKQATAERDLVGGRRDEAASRRDEAARRRDEAAEQRDLASGARDQVGDRRDLAGGVRDKAADEQDQAAAQRDLAAERRDLAAEQRDLAAEEAEAVGGAGITPDVLRWLVRARREAASDRKRASQDRGAGADERTQSGLDRSTSVADRGAGASRRTHAGLDRDAALADRGLSAKDRKAASVDELTGVFRRGPGFAELEREVARARRTEQPLAVAFVDVDRLKAVNDSRGHAAGDRLLLEVANTLRAKLRSYDLVIRYGGDEFVCALAGLNLAEAATRLALVNAALAEAPEDGSVTVGLAELQPDETLGQLVARADAALYQERQRQRGLHG